MAVFIALALLVNSCLDSRREQALKDYNRDVATIVQDADANADAFYETLAGGGDDASTDVQSQLNQLRLSAQRLTEQAEDLSVPDEMRPPHRNLLLSLSLLQEAMGRIAEKLPKARASDPSTAEPAVRGIAGEMQAFVSADVIYNRRTKTLIKDVLDEEGIGGQTIQSSSFLQNLGWLQPSTVARRINASAGRGAGDGGTTEPAPGLHGHGLLAVSVGDKTLQPDPASNVVAVSGSSVTFDVKFANQGEHPEADVKVKVTIRGAGTPKTTQKVVDQTQPGAEVTVAVPVSDVPLGEVVTVTVEVVGVPGEKNTQNNRSSYPSLFERS